MDSITCCYFDKMLFISRVPVLSSSSSKALECNKFSGFIRKYAIEILINESIIVEVLI